MSREKAFAGYERRIPRDRNAKARLILLAQGKRRARQISRAALDVLRALVYHAHNSLNGRCYPSYDRLAELAGCARSTVGEALPQLEAAGLIEYCNRLVRTASGRVERTSNGYVLKDPGAKFLPKSDNPTGTPRTWFSKSLNRDDQLEMSLAKLQTAVAMASPRRAFQGGGARTVPFAG